MNIRLINRTLVTYLLLLILVTSNAQISTNQGFEILGNVPSDTRDTLTTLGDTSNVVWIYPGLLSYAIDQDAFWYNTGSYWKLFESGGLNNFYASGDTLYALSPDSLFAVYLGNYLDNDTIYQTLSLSNDTLYLTDGGSVFLPYVDSLLLADTTGVLRSLIGIAGSQYIDTLQLQGDTLLQISLFGDNQPLKELNLSSLSTLVDSTRLIQDSILVYYQAGIEIGRDTITGTGGGGGVSDNLGNHIMTQNLVTNGNWISGDGGNEGIGVDASGKVGIGTLTPSYILEINSTDAVRLPVGTTAQRPTGANGLLRYNSDLSRLEGYYNAEWNGLVDANFDLTDFTSSLTENYVPIASADGSLENSKIRVIGTRNYFFEGGNLSLTGTDNIAMGNLSGVSLTSGISNTFIGNETGRSTTSGSYNVAIGAGAGRGITTGNSNLIVGIQAGLNIGAGAENNMFGSYAGQLATGSFNNYYGRQAGQINPSSGNNMFGQNAGRRSTGGTNIYIGREAGEGENSPRNNTGSGNIFLGETSGRFNMGGADGIMIGRRAGYNNKNGNYNIFLGYQSAYNPADTISDGSYNIFLGHSAGDNISGSASNNILIGKTLDLQSGTGSNQLSIANAIFGTGLTGTGTSVAAGAKIGINTPSPTARLHLPAGTATANTSPLKFTSGTNLTTPEAGAMEWDGTNLFITQTSGPTRKQIAYTDDITAETNDLSSSVTWANVPDANITESSVNQWVEDSAYGAGWNGDLSAPTKNSIYDKIETLGVPAIANRAVVIGSGTGIQNISGFNFNTAGTLEWYSATGSSNLGAGTSTLSNLDASSAFNSGFGPLVMGSAVKTNIDQNSGFGAYALQYLTTGDNNTSSGAISGNSLTSGSDNTFTGTYSGFNLTTGSGNVFSGSFSGYNDGAQTHSNMIATGYQAGYNVDILNSESIFIGSESGKNESTYQDLILIGAQSQADQSNQIVIGHQKSGYESTQLKVGNYRWNIDQTVGAGQDNYVMTYDNASGELRLEEAASISELNDLSSVVTWDTIPDLYIQQSSVTQHQAALSITESQISDLAHTNLGTVGNNQLAYGSSDTLTSSPNLYYSGDTLYNIITGPYAGGLFVYSDCCGGGLETLYGAAELVNSQGSPGFTVNLTSDGRNFYWGSNNVRNRFFDLSTGNKSFIWLKGNVSLTDTLGLRMYDNNEDTYASILLKKESTHHSSRIEFSGSNNSVLWDYQFPVSSPSSAKVLGDSDGDKQLEWIDYSGFLGDNLGNHNMTQNLIPNSNWIGDDAGIYIGTNGNIAIGQTIDTTLAINSITPDSVSNYLYMGPSKSTFTDEIGELLTTSFYSKPIYTLAYRLNGYEDGDNKSAFVSAYQADVAGTSQLVAGNFLMEGTHNSGTRNTLGGILGQAINSKNGNVTYMEGVGAYVINGGLGTVTDLVGVSSYIDNWWNGTTTRAYGFRSLGFYKAPSGTITNAYAFYQDDEMYGTNNYGVYIAATNAHNYFAGTLEVDALNNTIDSSSVTTPINFLYTNSTGKLLSGSTGNFPVTNPLGGTNTIQATIDSLNANLGGGGGASQLSDLTDVNTSTPTNRNVLVADGTDWESRPLVEADISDLTHTGNGIFDIANDEGTIPAGLNARLGGDFSISNSTGDIFFVTKGASQSVGVGSSSTSAGYSLSVSKSISSTSGTEGGIAAGSTIAPATTSSLTYNGIVSSPLISGSSNMTGDITAAVLYPYNTGTGTISNLYGMKITPITLAGTITNLRSLAIAPNRIVGGSVTNVTNIELGLNGGAYTNYYGVRVLNTSAATTAKAVALELSAGANKHNLYVSGTADNYFEGDVGIGVSSPDYKLDVVGTLGVTGTVRFEGYGQGNKEVGDLALTNSGYLATYATDGTLMEIELTNPYGGESSITGVLDSLYTNQSTIKFLGETASTTISPDTLKIVTGESTGSDYAITATTSFDSLILKFFPAGLSPMPAATVDIENDEIIVIDVSETPDKAKRIDIQEIIGQPTVKITPAEAATVDLDAHGLMNGKIQINMTNVTAGITLTFTNFRDGGEYLVYFTNVSGTDEITLPSGCINLQGAGSTVSFLDITQNDYMWITYDGTSYYFHQ